MLFHGTYVRIRRYDFAIPSRGGPGGNPPGKKKATRERGLRRPHFYRSLHDVCLSPFSLPITERGAAHCGFWRHIPYVGASWYVHRQRCDIPPPNSKSSDTFSHTPSPWTSSSTRVLDNYTYYTSSVLQTSGEKFDTLLDNILIKLYPDFLPGGLEHHVATASSLNLAL